MKKLFFFLFFSIFLIGLVNAEANPCGNSNSYLGQFKQNERVVLYQYCTDCTYSNVTSVKYPNSTNIIFNIAMNKNGQEFTTNFVDTGQIGCYTYLTKGDKGGVTSYEPIDFKITPSGFTDTLGFYILILVLSLGIILLGYYVQDVTIVVLGSFGLVFLGLYILFNGLNGIKDAVYTWAIGLIILGLSFYLLVRASQEFLD